MQMIPEMAMSGAAIGILISAPMGPVGILCIQRTLNRGRRPGFFTGIGAALSDLFYCLITGFGLSFIEDFLESNKSIIQLVGSVLLILFGAYLYYKNPAKSLQPDRADTGAGSGRNLLTGFLFTLSNPLILFLTIGLFARFNFLLPDHQFYHYIVGYAFLFGGAVGWWWLVTWLVNKARGHFNMRSMSIINRITALIISLFGVVGIITAVIDMVHSA